VCLCVSVCVCVCAFSGLREVTNSLGKAIIGAFAIQRIISFARESAKLNAQFQGIERAFKKLDNSVKILNEMRKATRGTVSELELMRKAVQAKNLGVPIEQLGTLFEFATNRAIETGASVEGLTESIVTGIGRKSILIIDNLGISSARVAAEMAKTGDFAKAVTNIINEEMAAAGEVLNTSATNTQRLTASFENLQVVLGQIVNNSTDGLKGFLSELIDNRLEAARAEGGYQDLNKILKEMGEESITRLNFAIAGGTVAFRKWFEVINKVIKSGDELNKKQKIQVDTIESLKREAESLILVRDNADVKNKGLIRTLNIEIETITRQIEQLQKLGVAFEENGDDLRNAQELYDKLVKSIDDFNLKLFESREELIKTSLERAKLNEQLESFEGDIENDPQIALIREQERGLDKIIDKTKELEEAEKKRAQGSIRGQNALLQNTNALFTIIAQSNRDQGNLIKAIGITQAIINTSVGITKAIAEVPFPLSVIVAASYATLGAAQISLIQNQPSFAEGTEFVDRMGKYPRGTDKVPANLDRGEAVIPKRRNNEYPGLAKAFIDGKADEWFESKWLDSTVEVTVDAGFNDFNMISAIGRGRKETKRTNDLLNVLIDQNSPQSNLRHK